MRRFSIKTITKIVLGVFVALVSLVWAMDRSEVYSSSLIEVACPGDYPGGCLSKRGEFVGKEIDIIKSLFGEDDVKFVYVCASNVKQMISKGMYDIGCGGWFTRDDGALYSNPIIENIQVCVVKSDAVVDKEVGKTEDTNDGLIKNKVNKVFVQIGTVCSQYAEEKYENIIKFNDFMECVNAYNACDDSNKVIILDSINLDYLLSVNGIKYSTVERFGNYSIALVCKNEKTRNEVNLRIDKYFTDLREAKNT